MYNSFRTFDSAVVVIIKSDMTQIYDLMSLDVELTIFGQKVIYI